MYFFKFKFLPTLIGLLITFTFCWLYFVDTGNFREFIDRINHDIYDIQIRTMKKDEPNSAKNLVIVSIDEASLKKEGRWPWSRNKLVQLTKQLQNAGATVIAYDIMFAEQEKNPLNIISEYIKDDHLSNILPDYHQLYSKLNFDKHFANTLQNSETILGFALTRGNEKIGALPKTIFSLPVEELNLLPVPLSTGYIAPISMFRDASTGEGFVSYIRDDDGITRRIPLLMRYQDLLYPSLALETARIYLLYKQLTIKKAKVADKQYLINGVNLGDYTIPTDKRGQVYAPLMNVSSIPVISASKIISGDFRPQQVEGKIILIGFTAKGLTDQVATPISSVLPGVFIHASIIQGILNKALPQRPNWAEGAELIIALLFGLLLALVLPWLNPLWSLALIAGSYIIIFYVDWTLWDRHYWVIHICIVLIMILAIAISNALWGFLFEQRLRKKFNRLFGQYVPPDHVKELIQKSSSQQKELEGESKVMTVLFADIMNFTSISESLSAQKIKELLNKFFTPISDIVLKNGGTIDKYVGDQIIAFWGAPVDNPQHQHAAIITAFEMLEKIDELHTTFSELGLPTVDTGIGINSGEMNVGDMGSVQRRAYTVLGDNVNLASRLESVTRYYGVPIIVGENTTNGVDDIIFMKLDCIYVKGKNKPSNIFQPICKKSDLTDEIQRRITEYEFALNDYLAGDWQSARDKFTKLMQTQPDVNLYHIFLQRMEQLDNQPPNHWDGNFDRRKR